MLPRTTRTHTRVWAPARSAVAALVTAVLAAALLAAPGQLARAASTPAPAPSIGAASASTAAEGQTAQKQAKKRSKMKVRMATKRIVAGKTVPRVKFSVTVNGKPAQGFVKVYSNRNSFQERLRRGKGHLRMARYPKAGTKRVRVKFFGDHLTKNSTRRFRVRIHAKK